MPRTPLISRDIMKKSPIVHFCLLMLLFGIAAFISTEVKAEDITLIVRGDDLGSTQGSLIAFEKAFNDGILTCASILPVAPWFEAAAELCVKNPGWSIGVHLSLVGEWEG